MKKIVLFTVVLAIACCSRIQAQDSKHKETIEIHSWSLGATPNGPQTVLVPGNKGTLKFNKQGEKFSNVVFIDSAGKTHRLQPASPSTAGGTSSPCKFPIPDACFATANKNIGMCMCKPTDLTTGGGEVTISLLLPAVQKVREAVTERTDEQTNNGTVELEGRSMIGERERINWKN